mmetsp:Transcript_26301/g.88409  ORF Transcript_26301/g.88409 Transcript_26301/m.88409 type:complete len:200 (+) Transcript_26301:688-1287(+)
MGHDALLSKARLRRLFPRGDAKYIRDRGPKDHGRDSRDQRGRGSRLGHRRDARDSLGRDFRRCSRRLFAEDLAGADGQKVGLVYQVPRRTFQGEQFRRRGGPRPARRVVAVVLDERGARGAGGAGPLGRRAAGPHDAHVDSGEAGRKGRGGVHDVRRARDARLCLLPGRRRARARALAFGRARGRASVVARVLRRRQNP